MKPDLLSIVESLFAVEQSRELWIAGVQEAASAMFGNGVASVFYDVSEDTLSLHAIHTLGVSDEVANMGRFDHTDAAYLPRVRDFYRSVMCAPQAVYAGWNQEYLERMAAQEIHDAVMINGLDASRVGVVSYLFSRQKINLTKDLQNTLERLAVHIASAITAAGRNHARP